MDELIFNFRKSVGGFCNHLQSSCDALKQSIERRPIPLDSASSTFIQCLNRRVAAASDDLNLLESMSFGTISFEELLGHCNEVYKKNQSDLVEVETGLKDYGYSPELETDDECEVCEMSTPKRLESRFGHEDVEDRLNLLSSLQTGISGAGSTMKNLKDDFLFEESLSLLNLGISDVCLATLSSKADDVKAIELDRRCDIKEPAHLMRTALNVLEDEASTKYEQKPADVPKQAIKIREDDYKSLPSSLKCLASWGDLLGAVEKFNSILSAKEKMKVDYFFYDEIASLGLGPKARCYLLILVRMKRLVVETVDGVISYRVLVAE